MLQLSLSDENCELSASRKHGPEVSPKWKLARCTSAHSVRKSVFKELKKTAAVSAAFKLLLPAVKRVTYSVLLDKNAQRPLFLSYFLTQCACCIFSTTVRWRMNEIPNDQSPSSRAAGKGTNERTKSNPTSSKSIDILHVPRLGLWTLGCGGYWKVCLALSFSSESSTSSIRLMPCTARLKTG